MKGAQEAETIRLYMPLEVTTYYEEDEYGRFRQTEYEGTLPHYELEHYADELNDFIIGEQSEIGNERGLMEYYGKMDSLNAKVQACHFEIEQVDRTLYGVAVCTLNAPLNAKELEEFKETIIGQATDGAGEGIEQRGFDLGQRDVYVHLWQSDSGWYLKTEEEMGFSEQGFEMNMG